MQLHSSSISSHELTEWESQENENEGFGGGDIALAIVFFCAKMIIHMIAN